MRCTKCGGKGYLEEFYHYGDRARPMIRQCCDISAYSRRVQLLTQTPEDAFKSVGRKEPFIGKEMNVTYRGVEIKGDTHARKKGEPCPVVPLKRK